MHKKNMILEIEVLENAVTMGKYGSTGFEVFKGGIHNLERFRA